MFSKHIKEFIVYEDESIYKAFWKKKVSRSIVIVVDRDDKFAGIIADSEFIKSYYKSDVELQRITAGEICNRSCKYCIDDENLYSSARNIFAEYDKIDYIPVIDAKKNVVDLFSRQRAFYQNFYKKKQLPRMFYAERIWDAALEAKWNGYDAVSVIEFGVAGGNGLVMCEFHAKEIQRLMGIRIEVYGFDSGTGLPAPSAGYKEVLHMWGQGDFPMDKQRLEDRLQFTKLVLGDIHNTSLEFFEKYKPAPIGVMLIDVDYYSSTLPILKMLENDHDKFLPRVQMYFDDVNLLHEHIGEDLAIKEFNASHDLIKISPEHPSFKSDDLEKGHKVCHRFEHPFYVPEQNSREKLNIPFWNYV